MLKSAAFVCLLLGCGGSIETPSEVESGITPANRPKVLRKSCYVISPDPVEAKQAYDVGCRYLRWLSYPFARNWGYRQILDGALEQLRTIKAMVPVVAGDPVGFEFALAEGITQEVDNIVLTADEAARLGVLGIPVCPPGADMAGPSSDCLQRPLAANYQFKYDEVKNPEFGDRYWNGGGAAPNTAVPSLRRAEGRLYQAWLALQAIDAGANAFHIAQPQLKLRSGGKLPADSTQRLATAVADLRKLKPGLIIGSSALHGFPVDEEAQLSRLLDFTKVIVDIDEYRMVNGVRVMSQHDDLTTEQTEGDTPCQLLGDARDAELLPRQRSANAPNLCVRDLSRPARKHTDGPSNQKSVDFNPHRLPMLLEADGYAFCYAFPGSKTEVVVYQPNNEERTSTCYPEVRHGLTNTMIFVRSPAEVRRKFIQYLHTLAAKLSERTDKPPVYYPLPVVLDQMSRKTVVEDWVRTKDPSQHNLVKVCPYQPADAGLPDPALDDWTFYNMNYHAHDCGDLPTIEALLRVPPSYQGCYTDGETRKLPTEWGSGHTVESCTAAARSVGHAWAGVQSGGYCFSGPRLGGTRVSEDECNLPCAKDKSQTCGGSWRNSIWDAREYAGCFADRSARALPVSLGEGQTIGSCRAKAAMRGLSWAGLQAGGQCFGGDALQYQRVADAECDTACTAAPGQICGGEWRNSIYASGTGYVGCYTDDSRRALSHYFGTNHTVETCRAAARAADLKYAALQYYGSCFGGNELGYARVDDSRCNTRCTANPSQRCGGAWLNSVYRAD